MKKLLIPLIIFLLFFGSFSSTFAIVTWPTPIDTSDYDGLFIAMLPICYNGAVVLVESGIVLPLLLPYVPVSPIVPVFKFAGPIPDSDTGGKFFWGGVCFLINPLHLTIPIPMLGTLIQIGTTLLPTPDAIYPFIYMFL
ncbi:MAG TPA: hypothetical protein VJH63_01825 [Candidatus Paceibacterota bacterium]